MRVELRYQEIEDPTARENFFRLQKFFQAETFLKGEWEFFEIVIPAAVTNYRYKHHLGYSPKDVLVTSTIGTTPVTFNYELFDRDFLDITTTGAATVRAFVGRFERASDR